MRSIWFGAETVVPDGLGAWLVQQRRWMNSANIMDLRQLFINLSWVNSRMRVFLYLIQLLRWVEFNAGLGICFVVVAVCEKILVDDPYHLAVGYAAFYVLFLSVSLRFSFADSTAVLRGMLDTCTIPCTTLHMHSKQCSDSCTSWPVA